MMAISHFFVYYPFKIEKQRKKESEMDIKK